MYVLCSHLLHTEDCLKKENRGISGTVVHALIDPGNECVRKEREGTEERGWQEGEGEFHRVLF